MAARRGRPCVRPCLACAPLREDEGRACPPRQGNRRPASRGGGGGGVDRGAFLGRGEDHPASRGGERSRGVVPHPEGADRPPSGGDVAYGPARGGKEDRDGRPVPFGERDLPAPYAGRPVPRRRLHLPDHPAARQSREVPDQRRVRPAAACREGGRAMTVAARVEARLRSLSTRERILVLVCAIALILFAV